MRWRIVIMLLMAMLMAMPVTHYLAYKHGRATMNVEAVKRQGKISFVLGDRIVSLEHEIVKNLGTCGNCHEGRV